MRRKECSKFYVPKAYYDTLKESLKALDEFSEAGVDNGIEKLLFSDPTHIHFPKKRVTGSSMVSVFYVRRFPKYMSHLFKDLKSDKFNLRRY